ncbi:hypothetical protein DIRU0_B06326 [Diutina rugosa]
MSAAAAKQAGITLNRAFAITAKTTRAALKPEFKTAADKRGVVEAKAVKYENGVPQGEAKFLGTNPTQ